MSKHSQRNDRRGTKKVLATIAVGGMTAAAVSAGTFAAFTGSDSVAQPIDTAAMTLTLADPTTLDDTVSNMVPGDSASREATLTFVGDAPDTDGDLHVTVQGNNGTLDPELDVTVSACAVAWVGGACVPGATVLRTAAAPSATESTATDLITADGQVLYLRATTAFDPAAGNAVQGQQSTLTYTFRIDQRPGVTTR